MRERFDRRGHDLRNSQRIGVSEEWILKRTGIHSRRVLGHDERLTDLAAHAARDALERAALNASELDMVLVATTTSDDMGPPFSPAWINSPSRSMLCATVSIP